MKNCSKTLLSLCLCLLLTLLALQAVAEEAQDNVIFSQDFEHNDVASLGTPDGEDEDNYYAVGDVSIVAGGAEDSAYCLKITGSEVGNGWHLQNLKSNAEYTVTYWAKTANCDATAYPNFGVNGYDGGAYQAIDKYTGDWAQYTLRFTTGADSTTALIYTWTFGSGTADFLVDNVVVTEIAGENTEEEAVSDVLFSWDFADTNLEALAEAKNGYGYYALGDVSIVEGGANEGPYALKVYGGEAGNGIMVGGLEKATAYVVTFWAKADYLSGAAYPSVGVNSYDGDAYQTVDSFEEDWMQYTLQFTTGPDSTSVKFYTWIFNTKEGSASQLFMDDVQLMTLVAWQGLSK